jgi:hypothetical protein
MKLTVMKLICLLVLLGGVFLLCLIFDVQEAQQGRDYILSIWPRQGDGSLNLRLPGMILGIVLVVVGAYGFLPRIPCRKGKTITYPSAQGDIQIQLKPVRKALTKVMRKMPEVYAINLDVKPDKDGKHASIIADVVLRNSTTLAANRCARMVADYLAATAREVLAVENLGTVRVNVKGVHVNASKAGRQMREQVAANAEKAAYAPHTAINDIPAEAVSTDNFAGDALAVKAGSTAAEKEGEDTITAEEEEQLTRLPNIDYTGADPAREVKTGGSDKETALPPLLDDLEREVLPSIEPEWENTITDTPLTENTDETKDPDLQ